MTDTVQVHTASADYPIYIGSMPCAAELAPFVSGRTVLVVTDSNLAPVYLYDVKMLLEKSGANAVFTLAFESGESSKTLEVVGTICSTAAMRHLNRKSVIVALGGGVAGDMAGFAAAIFMRGIDFIQMPTSLLAMVDSSVGGKTGADLPEGKNLIGAFHQPIAVFSDTDKLKTLPEREFNCGVSEIVKMAAVLDRSFFEELEKNAGKYHDQTFLRRMICRSCELKAEIVSRDEKEGSVRAYLNFGHTFGHALESLSGFTLPHGEGVAAGMKLAAAFGEFIGITPSEDAKRLYALTDCAIPMTPVHFVPEDVYQSMLLDKKAVDGGIRFVLMPSLGRASIVTPDRETILKFLRSYPQ